MGEWLTTIIGIAFLAVLLDMVYPNGKTNAFCKSIFAIIIAFVMISPLVDIKNSDLKINYIDNAFAENILSSKKDAIIYKIENHLNERGIKGVFVEIEGNISENEFSVDYIYIDISETVLSDNLKNINKYEVIQKSILEIVDIDLERIIIYG